jgi:Protein of unknown function (DUF2786)
VGKESRQRRLKKEKERLQRRHEREPGPASQARAQQAQSQQAASPQELAAAFVAQALYAQSRGLIADVDKFAGQLADDGVPGWTSVVDHELRKLLHLAVGAVWRKGWQPAELVRQVGRQMGGSQARLATDMVAEQMLEYAAATVDDRWTAQLDMLGAEVWWGSDIYLERWRERDGMTRIAAVIAAVALVYELGVLPVLATLGPLPGAARRSSPATVNRDVDERMLGKIRALLAKAESTEFEEEAEALSTRAQELMARYSIDHALLAAESGSKDKPLARRIPVDNPYESPKAHLLTVVAEANRCRAVFTPQLGLMTVFGFPADLDAVELLFTSLLVQATTALVRAGSRSDRHGRSRTRSFRQSFLLAYAIRIGERLTEAAGAAERAVAEESPGRNLLPVLAARDREVTEAVDAMFTNLRRGRSLRASDEEGWQSGRAAADLAALHASDQLES